MRVFPGWWIVAGGFAVQMFAAGMTVHSSGALLVKLQEEFGWSKALISGAFAVGTIGAAALAPFQGRLIDRFGPRGVVQAGAVLLALGMAALSRVSQPVQFYLAMLVVSLGFTLLFDVAFQTAAANWFRRRRTTALAIMMAGFGAGGLIVPAAAWGMNTWGWRSTAVGGGIIVGAVALLASLLLRRSPESVGLLPDGDAQPEAAAAASPAPPPAEYTGRQALATRAFWLLALGQLMLTFVASAISVHLVPLAKERLGLSLEASSAMQTTLLACAVAGQLIGGYLGDRVDKRKAIVALVAAQAGALALVAFGNSWGLLLTYAVVQGLLFGVRSPLLVAIRADYFGRRSYGLIYGLSLLVMNVGGVGGAFITGLLADRFEDYTVAFVVLIALTGVATLLLAAARRPVSAPGVAVPATPRV